MGGRSGCWMCNGWRARVTAAALMLLAGGCGNGDDATETDPPEPPGDEPADQGVAEPDEGDVAEPADEPEAEPEDVGEPADEPEAEPEDVGEPAETNEAADDAWPETVLTYLDAVGSQQPRELEQALELVVDDSPAAVYLGVQYAATFIQQDQYSFPADPFDVDPTEEGIELCNAYGEVDMCMTYADFELDNDRLVSFTIDGVAIDDQVGTPGTIEELGVTFEVLGAYQSVETGELLTAVDLTGADEERNLAFAAVDYIDPDNRQRSAHVDGYSGNPLRANVSQLVMLRVEDAQVGGEFIVQLSTDDHSNHEIVDVTISTS